MAMRMGGEAAVNPFAGAPATSMVDNSMGSRLMEILQNRFFQQAVSQAGAGIAGKGSVADLLNQIYQSNIAAESKAGVQDKYTQMLSKMLGGAGMPKDSKAVIDAEGIKLNIGNETIEKLNGASAETTDMADMGAGAGASAGAGAPVNPFLLPS